MNPEIWGPPAWNFLHLLSLSYPIEPTYEEKTNFKNFIYSLQKILPCDTCSNNFLNKINNSNLDKVLESRDTLFEWFVDIHNIVNKENNKKEWTYSEVYYSIMNKYSKKKIYHKKIIYCCCTILTLFIIFILLQKNTIKF